MKRFAFIAAAMAIVAVPVMFFVTQTFAVSEGQINGGNENYKIKNITQNTAYANPANANSCDELEYTALLL